MKALRVTTEGTWEDIDMKPGLQGYYEAIGCKTMDLVRLDCDLDLWCDDEGLLNGSEENILATALRQIFHRVSYELPLTGNVVLTGGCDSEGETMPLTQQTRDRAVAVLEQVKKALPDLFPA